LGSGGEREERIQEKERGIYYGQEEEGCSGLSFIDRKESRA
jgi:hypothetical protein